MAYGFGSGVQAQLGATDYSNYLRGALSGAQMQAQGGAAIGAGVQNALAGIGEGIQKYQENKILSSKIMGAVETNIDFLANKNPELMANAPEEVTRILNKMETGKGVGLKDAAFLESWSGNARKDTETNIENTAIATAFAPNPDGSLSTNIDITKRYVESGGLNPEVIRILNTQGKLETSKYQDIQAEIAQASQEQDAITNKFNQNMDLQTLYLNKGAQDLNRKQFEADQEARRQTQEAENKRIELASRNQNLNEREFKAKQKQEKQETKSLNRAISLNTGAGTGEIDIDGFRSMALGEGVSPDVVGQAIEALQLNDKDFNPKLGSLSFEDGTSINFIQTSNGQIQIIRPGQESGTTAGQTIREKAQLYTNARNLYKSGDSAGAFDILQALGAQDSMGFAIAYDSMGDYFGTGVEDAMNAFGKPFTRAPFTPEENSSFEQGSF